jgi:sugar phosphate isomerase/epimerase
VKEKFEISVAAWSWRRMFEAGQIKQIDQPRLAREAGATGLELVNSFFPSPQYDYLQELKKIAANEGIRILLIMCDGEGSMYAPDFKERRQAIINHHKWLDIAAVLGCHTIRCNSGYGVVPAVEAMKNAADSFYELCDYARQYNLNVAIENHWGLSSHPDWLVGLMKMVDVDNFGTLPDFGNFPDDVDHYRAVEMMMPFAKAVSAKCHDFDAQGNEIHTDFERMMKIVFNAGYHGYVGVEYEGGKLGEIEGVKACVKLLNRFREGN